MKNPIRRKDRLLPDSDAKEILKKGEYGILSTVGPDGEPYGVPLNYSYDGNVIHFHCAREGRKVRNIEAKSAVSFCVVGRTEVLPGKFTTKYESVIVSGQVHELTGDEKRAGLLELVRKYSPGFVKEGEEVIEKAGARTRVYKIIASEITGKAS